MQWVQDLSQNNVDNLNNVRREASRHFRNKRKEYLKDRIDELETNSKIKNIRDLCRGIKDLKKVYQPRTNMVQTRRVVWLQTATVIWLIDGNISLSCSMYIGLIFLGKQKNTEQSHYCLSRVPLSLRWLLTS